MEWLSSARFQSSVPPAVFSRALSCHGGLGQAAHRTPCPWVWVGWLTSSFRPCICSVCGPCTRVCVSARACACAGECVMRVGLAWHDLLCDIPGLQSIVFYVDVLLLVTIWSSPLLSFIHRSLQMKKHPHAGGLSVSRAGSLNQRNFCQGGWSRSKIRRRDSSWTPTCIPWCVASRNSELSHPQVIRQSPI